MPHAETLSRTYCRVRTNAMGDIESDGELFGSWLSADSFLPTTQNQQHDPNCDKCG